MKKQLFFSICCLLTGIAAQAATLPQGQWTVTQVTIEKNTGGDTQTTVYNTAADVQSFIPCMQEIEINGKSITLYFPNGRKETTTYTLEGDLLTINNITGAQVYRYSINGEDLILTATYNYVNNNLAEKKSVRITEQRIIILKNK